MVRVPCEYSVVVPCVHSVAVDHRNQAYLQYEATTRKLMKCDKVKGYVAELTKEILTMKQNPGTGSLIVLENGPGMGRHKWPSI